MYASGIQVKLRWVAIAVLAVALAVVVIWTTTGSPPSPAVLTAERLEIVEPDGSLAIVLANSQRPPVGTINGQVIMEGQEEERRGIPSIVFFDGKGDEVGGMAFGVRGAGDEFQAIRHIALDAHEQDQAVVLMHHQDPSGSMSGLSVSDLPAHSLPDALAELGLAVGASRQQLQAAIMQIPEDERGSRLGGCLVRHGRSSARLTQAKPRSRSVTGKVGRASSSKRPVRETPPSASWTVKARPYFGCPKSKTRRPSAIRAGA